jgi:diguanylate cyclase (GGDEF)-like protein
MQTDPDSYDLSLIERRQLSLPLVAVASVVTSGLFIYGLFAPPDSPDRPAFITYGIAGTLYSFLIFYLFPRIRSQKIARALVVVLNGVMISWLFILERPPFPGVTFMLYATVVFGSAVLIGRWQTYAFIAITLLATNLISWIFNVRPVVYPWSAAILAFLITIAANETIYQLKRIIRRQMQRLEIVNKVTRSLTYSIEVHQVVSLMSSAVQDAIEADTYYIGFVDGDQIRLELFYDDGEFYNNLSYEKEDTLAGWVIDHRQSILLRNLPEEIKGRSISVKLIGTPRTSLSWMGTPLQTHDRLFGLAAVASYRKNAFDDNDLELLESFAQQAAISLENAYHHAEVERRSTLDSLTNVLNHGHFLKALAIEMEKAMAGNYDTSLIMLDVDFFKHYNDSYGHLVGDQVLMSLAEMIHGHVKSSDLVGRWGGEEFAVALLHTNGEQATMIAQRIRESLSKLEVYDREGLCIPPPTISQGIAVFPNDAQAMFPLIDLADQRLYKAKERGRDQIEPSQEYWERLEAFFQAFPD